MYGKECVAINLIVAYTSHSASRAIISADIGTVTYGHTGINLMVWVRISRRCIGKLLNVKLC